VIGFKTLPVPLFLRKGNDYNSNKRHSDESAAADRILNIERDADIRQHDRVFSDNLEIINI